MSHDHVTISEPFDPPSDMTPEQAVAFYKEHAISCLRLAGKSALYADNKDVEIFELRQQLAVAQADAERLRQEIEDRITTVERQLELIGQRAPGDFLDKRPVVQSLQMHARRLRAAIAQQKQNVTDEKP